MEYKERKTATYADWARTDEYYTSFCVPADKALEYTLANSKANGLPDIEVSPAEGLFLKLVAKSVGARKILEIGTLGGYSAIVFAQAIPEDGKVVSCELIPKHAEVARANIENAGLSHKIDVHVAPAVETLANIKEAESFDLCFIDADRDSRYLYWQEAKRLVRKGGIIIVDNSVRTCFADASLDGNPTVEVTRDILRDLKNDHGVLAAPIGMTGVKGFDGFLFAMKQ